LLYWTVEADAEGGVRFNQDIYDRDRAIAKALGEGYRPIIHTASDAN
jgi:murein L,D-transpeptidase YcbB/YkuD